MSFIINGDLHSPYFIFIRCRKLYRDTEVLSHFGIGHYQRASDVTPHTYARYAILADAGEWTLIADDWYYTLWHMPGTRDAIAQLGKSFDIFACSVGDSDDSFDFVYYRDGRMVRKHVVVDPEYRDGVVKESFGSPLSGEYETGKLPDYLPYVLEIARGLGIDPPHSEEQLRCYKSPAAQLQK
jgi:hypothetical protein